MIGKVPELLLMVKEQIAIDAVLHQSAYNDKVWLVKIYQAELSLKDHSAIVTATVSYWVWFRESGAFFLVCLFVFQCDNSELFV